MIVNAADTCCLARCRILLAGAFQHAFAHDVSHMCTGLLHADLDGCGDPRAVFSQSGMVIAIPAMAIALSVSMIFFKEYYLKRETFTRSAEVA